MLPRVLADISSVPDVISGAVIIVLAALLVMKVVGTLMKLVALLLIGIGIYVWVS